jgi:hypothetical protein
MRRFMGGMGLTGDIDTDIRQCTQS